MNKEQGSISIFKEIASESVHLLINGGITPRGCGVERVTEMVGSVYGNGEKVDKELIPGEIKTDDWYEKKGRKVRVEAARDKEFDMKNALDDAVEEENVYSSSPGRVSGDVDAPCRVLKNRPWH